MPGDEATVKLSSQSRPSVKAFPSVWTDCPLSPEEKKRLIVWKPLLFVLALWVFNNMARRFPKHGGFFAPCPRVFPSRLSVKVFASTASVKG